MKVSLNWLKDFVNITENEKELEKLLSLKVIEVEQMYALVNATNLTIGEILECEMHPDSDHLHVCKVNLGDCVEQIVCGAPNCRKGIKVVVAKDGAVLPGNFKIKKSKVRGIESNGMCCSLQELGIEEKYVPEEFKNGIVILGNDAIPGKDPLKYLGLDDVIIELGLTPNRGDLLSHLGIAYDIASVKEEKISYKTPTMKNAKPSDISVKIDTSDCKAYYARKICNVQIKESPWWLKSRLISAGVRPINNIVDITNYVMLELGQPLHAFDADIIGNNIVVRNAHEKEKMVTLDDIERNLQPNDIVITDGKKPIALGGVMGGQSSSINEKTVNLILESAYFEPTVIRKTASRLSLHSESSMRFERKIDPNRVLLALDRATELYGLLANADIDYNYTMIDKLNKEERIVELDVARVNNYLGIETNEKELTKIYNALGFKNKCKDGKHTISIPTRRVDVCNYQDVLEEIARIYGYNNIEATIPTSDTKGALSYEQNIVRKLRHSLAGLGLNEVVNYSLISKSDLNKFGEFKDEVSILMPMTIERSTLRQTLINSLVDNLKYNKARQCQNISIFEIGKGYNKNEEYLLLSVAMAGEFLSSAWQNEKKVVDFYLIKGILEQVFTYLGIEANYVSATNNGLHNGQTAKVMINDKQIGVIGALHPTILKENDLDNGYVFEINLSEILKMNLAKKEYKPISKYPFVTRDIAIVIDRKVPVSDIISLVKQTGKKLIEANIFDIYEGEKIDSTLKSVAISLVFSDEEKTLTSEDVEKSIKSILKRLEFVYQAKLRS